MCPLFKSYSLISSDFLMLILTLNNIQWRNLNSIISVQKQEGKEKISIGPFIMKNLHLASIQKVNDASENKTASRNNYDGE